MIHSLGFSRAVRSAPDPTKALSSTSHVTLSPDNLISRLQAVKEKRKLFPELLPASPSSLALPLTFCALVPES
jgi:hypothetical protein